MAVELGMIVSISVFNPTAGDRSGSSAPEGDRLARTLTAWQISSSAAIAALTALGACWRPSSGRARALALAGLLLLATPLLLPRRERARQQAAA